MDLTDSRDVHVAMEMDHTWARKKLEKKKTEVIGSAICVPISVNASAF
jgi:hypothetical protein